MGERRRESKRIRERVRLALPVRPAVVDLAREEGRFHFLSAVRCEVCAGG
jgi:hypothetical protein